ncbi:MAG: helix-turn-helix transcriptional regulator [Rhodospirillaceae bacterium]
MSNVPARQLSGRERQCLQLLAAGFRRSAIAAKLGIKPVTVDLHIQNSRRKLGANTVEQAVALALMRSQIVLTEDTQTRSAKVK